MPTYVFQAGRFRRVLEACLLEAGRLDLQRAPTDLRLRLEALMTKRELEESHILRDTSQLRFGRVFIPCFCLDTPRQAALSIDADLQRNTSSPSSWLPGDDECVATCVALLHSVACKGNSSVASGNSSSALSSAAASSSNTSSRGLMFRRVAGPWTHGSLLGRCARIAPRPARRAQQRPCGGELRAHCRGFFRGSYDSLRAPCFSASRSRGTLSIMEQR